MATTKKQWYVGEDGCISVGETASNVTYHSALNSIIVSTKEPSVKIYDVASGALLQKSDLSANTKDSIRCLYLAEKDKVVFCDDLALGARSDLRGMLLLDTALQTPVSKSQDVIKAEVPLIEASQLLKSLLSASLEGVDHVEEVVKELEKKIECVQEATKGHLKTAKWATVCLELPYSKLKNVCSGLVQEMKKLLVYSPGLSVASALIDRLSYLLPNTQGETPPGPVEKAMMYSEVARQKTFRKWPHMNYKWALPDPMAQAGFYHQPNSIGDDRAMCFTCNVCLVCWEPTDEPWSEHERHAPACPFVKGEYTQNVPLCVTYGSQPAKRHGDKNDKIECMSTTTAEDYVATSTLHGSIVVWNTSKLVKRHCHFNLDPAEPVIAMKTGLQIERRTSKSGQQNTEEEAKTENNGTDEADASKISFNIGSDGTVTAIETTSAGTSREIKDGEMYELPPSKPENLESQNRTRPCDDIKVKSLCIVKKPSSEKIVKEVSGSSSKSKSKSRTKLQPTLICGASIRRTRLSMSNKELQCSKVDTKTEEVQLMNKVNKVVSEEIHPRIISSDEESSGDEMDINPEDLLSSTCFIPHLIVTAVRDSHRRHKHKEKEVKKPLSSSTTVGNLSGVPTLGSISMNHDWGLLDPLFDSDQDPDCQIVGITPGTGSLSVESPVTTKIKSVVDSQTECSTSQTQVESSRSSPQSGDGGGTSTSKSSKVKAGCVLQCIELPKELQSDCLEISVITPTLDKQHLVVIVSPVQSMTSVISKPLSVISDSGSQNVIASNCDESVELPSNVTSVTTLSSSKSDPGLSREEVISHPGGCILVYRYRFKEEYAEIDETPVAWKYIDSVSESVTSVLVLPQDFSDYQEIEEDVGRLGSEASSVLNGEKSFPVPDIHGQIVVTQRNGELQLLNLNDLDVLVEISPPDDTDKFVSATYCTGMERLCACSASGKLHIYQLCEECPSVTEPSTPGDVPDGVINGEGLHDPCPSTSTVESSDSRELLDKGSPGSDVLAKQSLTVESLMILHNLIQFENLMPRFTATVPSCWTEIQQEQQQRRHPQHLQHQGEATQHTRTWKLQPDNNTWDEHLFEIVLPRPCCVGHVDVKFNLHSMCTSPPDVQVTLLKQNITSLGRQTNSPSYIDVDRGVDFNISANGNVEVTQSEGSSAKPSMPRGECDNNVLDPAFQECHNAEILCGPVNVGSYLDLSGNSGVITLTSPQLLASKPKAFLLHIKGFPSKNDDKNNEKHKEMKKSAPSMSSSSQKVKVMKSAFDSDLFVPPSKAKEVGNMPLPRTKLPDNLKGCDWIQEISVTIRKTKKTQLPRERLQRNTMIDFVKFHERLLSAVSLEEGHIFNGVSSDHFQNMALDVLMWVAYIQMNDPTQRPLLKTLPAVVKPCLHAITKACYIQGTRTTAHKCSRFLALCMKQCKQSADPDLAPTFSSALLNALLETLPLLPCANFASSVRLFFTLLNRVKCMDTSKVAKQCLELLIQTSKQYNERTSSLHALLQSRFGLYGHPFDPDLFDCELPVALRQSNTILPTTSSVQNSSSSSSGNNNNNMTQPQTTVVEELDYYDLFNPPNDRTNKVQVNYAKSNIFGLLEVEPLHFTCHSTSDGTKMERMDTNVTGHTSYMGTSGLSGTINFGEMIPPQGAPGSSAATLASLSSGMAVAKQHLHELSTKSYPTFKHKIMHIKKMLSEVGKVLPAEGLVKQSGSSDHLLPPTPKTTPQVMSPPFTPPNETWQQAGSSSSADVKGDNNNKHFSAKSALGSLPNAQTLLQQPPLQVLVIERMHSGARRFVILDFGKPIVLTDVVIPACQDLASLSIDVWVQGEETDGQRFVVASDIGVRSLIMNDIMPSVVCRYLKITTIGRYGSGSTRSKIPIGAFYGHSCILPWEWNNYLEQRSSTSPSGSQTELPTQSQLLAQLGIYVSLLEDIQCRYSLARNRLEILLSGLDAHQYASAHVQYYLLKSNKSNEDDSKIFQAYKDCLQLQHQLNLAQRASDRLHRALGFKDLSIESGVSLGARLRAACTDKLRFLQESVVEVLLSTTNSSASVPLPPTSLYNTLSPQVAELLFKNLCISGGKKLQIGTGMLLMRVCGSQAWWGSFLGNILQEFFHSENSCIFSQDRVFVLLLAMGQKALTGPCAVPIMESLLDMLARVLSPLISEQPSFITQACAIDLTLVGWILLFLCRNLDHTTLGLDDLSKAAKKDIGRHIINGTSSLPNRWNFIQGDHSAMSNANSNSKGKSSSKLLKGSRLSMQKRLLHHKQKLMDLEQAKKTFFSSHAEKGAQNAGSALLKQQEKIFRKELSQYASKHIKDIIQMRRTEVEVLRKMPCKPENSSDSDKNTYDEDQEAGLVLPKEKTLRVVRGLMALLLSMDFTCNVDLFLVTCKVFATICITTRPAITLSEAMNQEQLEKLILLAANLDFSHGNVSWGGPWAGHAITCLLQDILDGEKFYPAQTSVSTEESEEALGFTTTETDDSLQNSVSLPQMEEAEQDTEPSSLENPTGGDSELSDSKEDSAKMNFDKESSLMVDLLLNEGDYDFDTSAKLHAYVTGESGVVKIAPPPDTGQMAYSDTLPVLNGALDMVPYTGMPEDKKKMIFKKLSEQKAEVAGNSTPSPAYRNILSSVTQGISTALDARMEFGLETQAEISLKVMLSLYSEGVQQAFISPLPVAPPAGHSMEQPAPPTTDDELSEASANMSSREASSADMLSQCYENLFNHLLPHCTNLDSLLQLWLTLNGDGQADGATGLMNFDPSHVPLIPLSPSCVTNLLDVIASIPSIPLCTWVLAFQTLTLLSNQRVLSGDHTTDVSMVITMLSDPNLMAVIKKFLSGTSDNGPVSAAVQFSQVGPSAAKCFYEFLLRLLVKCPADCLHKLKELMLKLVYTLSAERGAFHCGLGPLDAQCKFLVFILDNTYENVDISNAISVIESISTLVNQHILCQERVTCRSSSENSINARSCFGGLFASLLRGGDSRSSQGDSSRDMLMCSLLRLINSLIQIRVSPQRTSRLASVGLDASSTVEPATPTSISMSEPVPDSAKLVQALATSTPAPPVRLSDEEKERQTDEQKTENLNTQSDPGVSYIADIILGHRRVMCNLIQALSYCNSNTMAMILGSKGLTSHMQDTFTGGDPISVGDGIYQILVTLTRHCSDQKLILESLFFYLSETSVLGIHSPSVSRLSEPLLWFILKVLDSPRAMNMFLEMGGIQVICKSLVNCNSRVISTNPSLISTIIKNLNGRGRPANGQDSDTGLQNFAPLGSISSSSPTASPAEILIQAAAPHRRARSAAWSYHFYPDEAWVDLTVQLPFAVLLKEVQIQPHNASLTTCPAYVSIEISHDGVTSTPLCTPLMTSSLAFIKLQLQRPEIATVVTVRLHKARDSMTIGLSQLLLMGYSAFSENAGAPQNVLMPNEDDVSRSSVRWIRLLHHCLTEHKEVEESVASAAAPTPNLLHTCSALLVSPVSSVYIPNIEEVLLRLGLHSVQMGLMLIDNILRNPLSQVTVNISAPYLGKVSGHANDSTTELLYQLGIVQDSGTLQRVQALLQWLGDSARMALQRSASYSDEGFRRSPREKSYASLPSPAPIHIQCVSAVLWQSHELPVEYNLQRLISRDLVSSLYEWSITLMADSNLKRAVDYVLCAMCHISPEFFSQILLWMGVMVTSDNSIYASISDDRKDNSNFLQDSMTDDSKEANNVQGQMSNGQNSLPDVPLTMLKDFRHITLDGSHLATLALACKSPVAIKELLDSSFPAVLAQGLFEFCNKVISEFSDSCFQPEGLTDTTKTMCDDGMSVPLGMGVTSSDSREKTLWITADLVAPVLMFLGEVSSEPQMKEWLGGAEGNIFWPALLTMLCNTPTQATSIGKTTHRQEIMSVEHRSAIETAAVSFFTRVMSCHFVNQLLFAKVLCEVIKEQSSSTKSGQLAGSFPLSGFTRCLFLQSLLEDEKVTVVLRGTGRIIQNVKADNCVEHPQYCGGRDTRTVSVSLHTTIAELKNNVADAISLPGQFVDRSAEKSDESKRDLPLGSSYTSEMADYISSTVAGLAAKEKREKDDKSVSGSAPKYSLPPRPPTRRGCRSADPASSSVSSSIQMFVTSLYHKLIPNKALPGELTLSQLLQILHQRGFHHGQCVLEFTIKQELKKKDGSLVEQNGTDDWCEEEEDIPDEALLSIPPFPTALQVFASVGGLALLAEHLPLLYPEVSRQSSMSDTNSEGYSKGMANSGEDWVTVEPFPEDFYEHYELMSPAPHVSKNGGSTLAMPTIPPHSLVAFGLFLRLPGYAEVLLKERRKAQCLLRLVLGVTDDGDGGHILTSPIASSLPTLPFLVLKSLYDSTPLTTDDGVLLRRMSLDIWAIHLILACLSVLSHHAPRQAVQGFQQEAQLVLSAMQSANSAPTSIPITGTSEEKSQQYWAKGTGFGTGSTTSSWDAEQALLRQKSEEEHVACLLQVLASYINPGGEVPKDFDSPTFTYPSEKSLLPDVIPELLSQSCLVPAISSYLRNDSVLDMARHIPLYRALLELLRGIAVCPSLLLLLLPLDKENSPDTATSVGVLLDKMRGCVDTYASRLKSNKSKNGDKSETQSEEEENEGLALLIPNIQDTARIVKCAVDRVQKSTEGEEESSEGKQDGVNCTKKIGSEELYMQIMKGEQFDTFELVTEEGSTLKFPAPHHYENNIKAAGDVSNAARTRRLAQEAVTLSTSLPLSAGSSVFVRCDEERLDVMKVLITGPSETPYANGCFEFDVYFPQDYPNSPPHINLETTGNHTIRFNPNLYNDGKVCLSVLNTWHGRPEEKWNAQTSSFLQVLVSIQSLILVSEPYFNEPGYERSRGTPSGTASSREYDANIRQATVKWAMLEQIKNPSPCFKSVIHKHFWLKRHEVLKQCEDWIKEMESYCNDKRTGRTVAHSTLALKRHYNQLREEFAKMKPPEDIESLSDTEEIDPKAKVYSTESALSTSINNGTAIAGPSSHGDGSGVTDSNSNSVLEDGFC